VVCLSSIANIANIAKIANIIGVHGGPRQCWLLAFGPFQIPFRGIS
jgi:hypothetical protein